VGERQWSTPGDVGEVRGELTAARELALGSGSSDGFDGYETLLQARIAAGSASNVGVVVQDATGRYHAFETDVPPLSRSTPLAYHAVIPYVLRGARVAGWVNLRRGTGWEGKLDATRRLTDRAQLRQAYVEVLVDGVGLPSDAVYDSTGGTPAPGKVNLDLDLDHVAGHAGVAGAVPSDRTSPLPEPSLEVGPRAFGSLVDLRATLLHEHVHLNHARRAVEAVRRWREETTTGSFPAWLRKQRKAGSIDEVTYDIVAEQVTEASSSTEALAYLTSFLATYHLRDIVADGAGGPADALHFGKLSELATEWVHASHHVQDEVVRLLVSYRDEVLEEAHRGRLVDYAGRRQAEAIGNDRLFWSHLSR